MDGIGRARVEHVFGTSVTSSWTGRGLGVNTEGRLGGPFFYLLIAGSLGLCVRVLLLTWPRVCVPVIRIHRMLPTSMYLGESLACSVPLLAFIYVSVRAARAC